jgi:hypothetical protein
LNARRHINGFLYKDGFKREVNGAEGKLGAGSPEL